MLKGTRTKPVLIVTCWNDVDRNTLSYLLRFIPYVKDVKTMECVCRRWRDILCKDDDMDKWYWREKALDYMYNSDPTGMSYIKKEKTPDIIEWYKSVNYSNWRIFYRRMNQPTFCQEYNYMYMEWLMWRFKTSQSNKNFDKYFDIYAIGYCDNCRRSSKQCPVYNSLKSQVLKLDVQKCEIKSYEIKLTFSPAKGTDVLAFGREQASDGEVHYTSFELCIINRYGGKCKKHTINVFRRTVKHSILSKRQRKLAGKALWNDESKYFQESAFKSVLGHSNSKNSTYYSRQSNYENRITSGTSMINLMDIDVIDVVNLTSTTNISNLYRRMHDDTGKNE